MARASAFKGMGFTHERRAELGGDLYGEIVCTLTGLPLEQVEILGGVRIVDASGMEVWARPADRGFAIKKPE